MFDIGFSELMVIGLIALIVIGPEKLPRVARTLGHLVGRMQRYVADVKSDINREIELEDLRKMRDSVQQAATEIQSSMNVVGADLSKMESELNSSVNTFAADATAVPAAPQAVEGGDGGAAPKVSGPTAPGPSATPPGAAV